MLLAWSSGLRRTVQTRLETRPPSALSAVSLTQALRSVLDHWALLDIFAATSRSRLVVALFWSACWLLIGPLLSQTSWNPGSPVLVLVLVSYGFCWCSFQARSSCTKPWS